MHPETEAVHRGTGADRDYASIATPIYQTSNFRFKELGTAGEYRYTRLENPSRAALEDVVAALEGGTFARATASGMAAIAAALLLLEQGDHVLAPRDLYGGTYRLMSDFLPRLGLEFSFIDMCDAETVRRSARPETKLIWIETPSNPLLRITDVAAVTSVAREAGAITVADNTFLTPYFQRPLDLGVDVVVHSTTKYLNGHSDVIGGALTTRREDLGARLGGIAAAYGLGEAPFDAWLVLRGARTLPQRMEAHQRNAFALADYLSEHGKVLHVHYPGLEDHPDHELAAAQQSGFGGIVTFELDTAQVDPRSFFSRLELFPLAGSLGGVESLAGHPWTMSHSTMPAKARRAAGISEGTVRLSAGIEHPDDLIADVEQALAG